MFAWLIRHLSQFPGDKAGSHSVGKLLCHGSVLLVMMCRHLMIYWIELCPSHHLYSCSFSEWCHYVLLFRSTSLSCYRIFPIPLHRSHWVCILSCRCVGLFVRRWCYGFLVCCHWKNQLSNSKLHYYFVVLHFWLLSFAWDSSNSFKSRFCCSYCFACSFLFEIHLCRLLFLSVFVFDVRITEFAEGRQVSCDTIKLINY